MQIGGVRVARNRAGDCGAARCRRRGHLDFAAVGVSDGRCARTIGIAGGLRRRAGGIGCRQQRSDRHLVRRSRCPVRRPRCACDDGGRRHVALSQVRLDRSSRRRWRRACRTGRQRWIWSTPALPSVVSNSVLLICPLPSVSSLANSDDEPCGPPWPCREISAAMVPGSNDGVGAALPVEPAGEFEGIAVGFRPGQAAEQT